MRIIALTGGIAAGKSVVARRLTQLGAVHVDADVLAREVVAPGSPGLTAIATEFGPSVIASDGSLDRAALGQIVFSDAIKLAALNGITHPAVWRRARELFDEAERDNPDAIVVYDVPLLVEASADRPLSFDRVIVVHADTEERIQRLIENRGMSPREAEQRIRSQASDADRLAIADDVIDTNGTIEHTMAQVDALWAKLSA